MLQVCRKAWMSSVPLRNISTICYTLGSALECYIFGWPVEEDAIGFLKSKLKQLSFQL